MTSQKANFVILAILDGWGIAGDNPGNAISKANTVNMDKFWASYPHGHIQASGKAVGLPKGEDGNTETGHLNLGAGKIVYQDLERINMSIADGSFYKNDVLLGAIEHAKNKSSNLHLMGLVGAGGVHSNIEHLYALINMVAKKNFSDLYLHLFTDGRDSPPTAAISYVKDIEKVLKKAGVGKIASIMGRYWSMDRDNRWDRTAMAYFALTKGKGIETKSPQDAINASYKEGKTDEFIEPHMVVGDNGEIVTIKDDDSVTFFNFRIDRPRQLTKAFVFDDFSKAALFTDYDPYQIKYEKKHDVKKEESSTKKAEPFERGDKLKNLYFVTMTEYGKPITQAGAKPAFPPEIITMPLSSVISNNGLRQLKITESEKERFVTFYFNGLREKLFPQEEKIIIPSPKIPTYDSKPEMSAVELTDTLLKKMAVGQYNLVVINYPNADMVGHTGNIGAAVKAVEVVDECIGRVANFAIAHEGVLLITADHGNAEEMINLQTNQVDTEHSTNPVPFIAVSSKFLGKPQTLSEGILGDVAPTILKLLGLSVPGNMTGRDLLSDISKY